MLVLLVLLGRPAQALGDPEKVVLLDEYASWQVPGGIE